MGCGCRHVSYTSKSQRGKDGYKWRLAKWIFSRKHHTIIEERRRYFDRVIIKDSDLDPANIANRAIYDRAPGDVMFLLLYQILGSQPRPADRRGLVDRAAALRC